MISNTLVQFVTPAVRVVLGLVLTAALTRYLGVEGFGEYALVFAYVAGFNGVFNDAGLGTILLREISRHPDQRASLLSSAAALQACVALVTYGLMLGGLLVLQYPAVVKASIAIYGLMIFFTPIDLLALPFHADLRLTRLLAPSLLGVLLSFVLSMLILQLKGPLEALIGAALAALTVQYAWITLLSVRAVRFAERPMRTHWLAFVREAWPMWLATVGATALQQIPVLVLSLFSLQAVGLFNAANRIPQQLLLIPLAIRASTFPLLSRAWAVDPQRFTDILDRLIRVSLLLAVPLALLGVGLAEPITRLLFGAAFADAAKPFALLSCILALLFPGILVGEALIAAGRQRLNLAILAASLPVLGGCLAWLVPGEGAVGAAVALLVSYSFIVLATFVAAAKTVGQPTPVLALGPAVLGSALGTGALLLSSPLGAPPAAVLAALVAVVAIALVQPSTLRDLWSFRPFPSPVAR